MADSDGGESTRLGERIPTAMRIQFRYPDVAAFIEKFAVNISRGGVFIASKSPLPVGTLIRFEFQLAHRAPLIKGEGEVVWVKPFEAEHPNRPHGMGVRFTSLDPDSRLIVDRALAWKEAHARPGAPNRPPSIPPVPQATSSPARPPPLPAFLGSPGLPPLPPVPTLPSFRPMPPPPIVSIGPPPIPQAGVGPVDDLARVVAEWGLTESQISATLGRELSRVRDPEAAFAELERELRADREARIDARPPRLAPDS